MAEIVVPDQDLMINKRWTTPAPNVLINPSQFSSKSNAWQGPGKSRWAVNCELRSRAREVDRVPWRLFWDGVINRANFFKVRRACSQIRHPINPAGYVGFPSGTFPFQCGVQNMPASVTFLKAGQFATLFLPSGRRQCLMLAADLVTNAAGIGTATFTREIDEAVPGAGIVIEFNNPFVDMRLDNINDEIDESQGQLNLRIEASEYV